MLVREPWATISIAATLALGIGATTATYAVFNFVLFRPVPGVPTEEPLVTVLFQPSPESIGYGRSSALPAMREAASGLEGLAYGYPDTLAVAAPAGSPPAFEEAEFVTSQFFRTLGLTPRAGRFLTDAEADSGARIWSW